MGNTLTEQSNSYDIVVTNKSLAEYAIGYSVSSNSTNYAIVHKKPFYNLDLTKNESAGQISLSQDDYDFTIIMEIDSSVYEEYYDNISCYECVENYSNEFVINTTGDIYVELFHKKISGETYGPLPFDFALILPAIALFSYLKKRHLENTLIIWLTKFKR